MGTHSYTVGVSFVLGAPAIHRLQLPRRVAKDMRGTNSSNGSSALQVSIFLLPSFLELRAAFANSLLIISFFRSYASGTTSKRCSRSYGAFISICRIVLLACSVIAVYVFRLSSARFSPISSNQHSKNLFYLKIRGSSVVQRAKNHTYPDRSSPTTILAKCVVSDGTRTVQIRRRTWKGALL